MTNHYSERQSKGTPVTGVLDIRLNERFGIWDSLSKRPVDANQSKRSRLII